MTWLTKTAKITVLVKVFLVAKNKFNKDWLNDHLNDPYVKMAQREGYRARAAYKLKEIDEQDHLIGPGMVVRSEEHTSELQSH